MHAPPLSRPGRWLLGLIVVAAAVVRFRSLDFGLPLIKAHPDENFIIEAARSLLSGRLPNFFDYPWLYIYFVSAGYIGYFLWGLATGAFHTLAETIASWPMHWEPFFIISRFFSALFGTASVLVVFRLGRQLRSETTGLAAALFLALAFMHARDSHFGTTDVTMTFFILCSVGALVDAHQTRRPARFVLAGVFAGLAAATKYNAAVLAVPVIVSWTLTLVDSRDKGAALRDPRVWYLGLAFVLVLACGVPFVVIDRERFLAAMKELTHAVSVGDPVVTLGNGWLQHLRVSLRYAVGVPLLVTGLAGAATLLVSEPRQGTLWLSFPIAYFIVAGSVGLLFFRYVLPIVPFLCLTAAYLLARGVESLDVRFGSSARLPLRVLTALAALTIVFPSASRIWAFDRVIAQRDSRMLVGDWFLEHAPAGGTVAISGGRYGFAQFDASQKMQVWQWDGGRNAFMYANRRTVGRPDWILVQESPLPSMTQPLVSDWLKQDYVHERDFHAVTLGSADLVYDQLDSFYMPFAGFEFVERPGPNFSLYRSTSLTPDREPAAPRP
jgi:4-amino-4-deoxy-L-arabinose transferase-like glycosyltransferase